MRIILCATATVLLAAATTFAEPIASVGKVSVDRQDLVHNLIQANGLNMTMNMLVMELARQEAIDAGNRVTEEEVQNEYHHTLSLMFEEGKDKLTDEERESLLQQYLDRENASKAEFMIIIRTNAYLRAIVRPALEEQMNDEVLQRAFNVQYGEKVVVRHIALPNLEEVRKAQKRLNDGELFATVAAEMSINKTTAANGGEMRPFTRQTLGMPETFKSVAFELEPGEVSEPVQADDAYHLIKLERRIPPQLVKFEDVKEALREQLADGYSQAQIVAQRHQLAERVVKEAKMNDPFLAEQLKQQRAALKPKPLTHDQIEDHFDAERPAQSATQPSTRPSTQPSTQPTEPQVQP